MNASLWTQTGLLIHAGGFLVLNSAVDQNKVSPRLCWIYLRFTHSRDWQKNISHAQVRLRELFLSIGKLETNQNR